MNQVLGLSDTLWAELKALIAEDAKGRGPGHYEYEFVYDEIIVTFHPENKE